MNKSERKKKREKKRERKRETTKETQIHTKREKHRETETGEERGKERERDSERDQRERAGRRERERKRQFSILYTKYVKITAPNMGNTPSAIQTIGSRFQTGESTISRAMRIVKYYSMRTIYSKLSFWTIIS